MNVRETTKNILVRVAHAIFRTCLNQKTLPCLSEIQLNWVSYILSGNPMSLPYIPTFQLWPRFTTSLLSKMSEEKCQNSLFSPFPPPSSLSFSLLVSFFCQHTTETALVKVPMTSILFTYSPPTGAVDLSALFLSVFQIPGAYNGIDHIAGTQ